MIFAQFEIADIGGLLKYGISGLSAIAFLLSFYLLNKESGRPKPRPEMLRSIRMFMFLTIVLGVLSGIAIMRGTDGSSVDKAEFKPKPKPTAKAEPEAKSFIKKMIEPRQKWQIEVFYEAEVSHLANQVADELGAFKDYEAKLTPLTAQRKKELKITKTQIRHEITEKDAAAQMQRRLIKVMPQDVDLLLKQISSSSPNYISVFLTK